MDLKPECPFKLGDVLESATPYTLARKILVTHIYESHIVAKVLDGENAIDPLLIFRAGWPLYKSIPTT